MQIAVDTKHNLIAEQQVHSKVTDLLAETATAARENRGVDTIDAVAARGYFRIQDIEDCVANGVTPFVPKPHRSLARSRGRFPKSAFRYDSESDTYICPAGRSLEPRYRGRVAKHRDGTWTISYFNWDDRGEKVANRSPSTVSRSFRSPLTDDPPFAVRLRGVRSA